MPTGAALLPRWRPSCLAVPWPPAWPDPAPPTQEPLSPGWGLLVTPVRPLQRLQGPAHTGSAFQRTAPGPPGCRHSGLSKRRRSFLPPGEHHWTPARGDQLLTEGPLPAAARGTLLSAPRRSLPWGYKSSACSLRSTGKLREGRWLLTALIPPTGAKQ